MTSPPISWPQVCGAIPEHPSTQSSQPGWLHRQQAADCQVTLYKMSKPSRQKAHLSSKRQMSLCARLPVCMDIIICMHTAGGC